ncbi:uncharacterized protein DNG_09209 [Cephalotrichum gorgonifer]|uniref:F-box domain-containing protein n=1 Tax=Cephalotrichum gorgonifer TaxID=2041049 RepID=A0AAE8N6G7_9PEZI|nr:uncharacterized protein DNG_09209 [Cephalotrichum gorgonifer]
MVSLDLFSLETIVEMVCLQCNPPYDLHEQKCLDIECPRACLGLNAQMGRTYTLAALCKVSRQFNTIATRHLYHRPRCERWWLLARTLIERPDLARRVRHLSTREWSGCDITHPSFPHEVRNHWSAQLVRGYLPGVTEMQPNDAALLVLSLCPDVEEIDAAVNGEDMEEIREPRTTLAKLKRVSLAYIGGECGIVMQRIAPLMQAAPNVESLLAWQVEAADEHAADLENLRHLRVEESTIGHGSLWDLLSSCPKLTSFRYSAAGCYVGHEQFDAGEAQEAFVQLVPGLRSLWLDLSDADFEDLPAGDGVLRDLASLTELETLCLDMRCLILDRNPNMSPVSESTLDDEVLMMEDSALVDLLPLYTRDRTTCTRWDPDVPAYLSGVGQRGDYSDLAPAGHADTAKRSKKAIIDIELTVYHLLGPGLAVPTPRLSNQGFALHASCWRILVAVSPGGQVDIQRLLDVFRSFPINEGIINFGHDYGGVAQYEDFFGSGVVPAGEEWPLKRGSDWKYPRCDPLDIPTLRGFLKKQSSARDDGGSSSAISPYNGPAKADIFSKLPEEILSLIYQNLPSPDVARLRESSRICATATLRDSFWRSRFEPGHEFDYILGPDQDPESVAGQWKSLYVFTKAVQDTPEIANRRRIWGLAWSLHCLVAVSSGATLHGDEVASGDWRHWITASRSLCSLESSFTTGSRAFRTRTLDVPLSARIFVSFVKIYGTAYVSGLRLECESDSHTTSSSLGYIHSEILVSENAIAIASFLLAHGERGICGIAVLSATGALSPWVGDHEDIPKRRLVLDASSGTEGIIRYLKGGFDISAPPRSVIWYPDVPEPHYSIIGIGITSPDDHHPQRPVTLAIFGDSNGDRLSRVSSISVRVDSMGAWWDISGLTVSLTDGSERIGLAMDTETTEKTHFSLEGDSVSENDGSDQGTDSNQVSGGGDGCGNDSEDEEDETDYYGGEEYDAAYDEDEDDVEMQQKEFTFNIDSRNGERIVGIDNLRRSEHGPRAIKVGSRAS